MTAGRPDPKLVLSQVEVEALRTLRTRLNKPPVSDAACATLGRAFFQVLARNDLEPGDSAGAAVMDATLGRSTSAFVGAVQGSGMANLRVLLAVLHRRLTDGPAEWRAIQLAGAPQAMISRLLQLAGREPDPGGGA